MEPQLKTSLSFDTVGDLSLDGNINKKNNFLG